MTTGRFSKNTFALRLRQELGAVVLAALLMPLPSLASPTGNVKTYALQAGAYSLIDSAVETAEDLAKAGITCKIERGVKLFKVYCGDSLSRQEAGVLRARIAASGYPDAFIVKRQAAAADPSTPAPVQAPSAAPSLSSEDRETAPQLSQTAAAPTREEAEPRDAPSESPRGYSKKTLIAAVVITLLIITVVFLCVMIVLRRTGAVQAFYARRMMKRYGNIFKNVDEDSVSLRDLTEKLKGLGNHMMAEKLLKEKAEGSIGAGMLRDLYDATGITEKYLDVLKTSRSWKKRAFACEKLGKIGSGRAVSPLIAIVRDVNNEDEDVRAVALRSLGRIRDERSIPFLIEALGYPETWRTASSKRLLYGSSERREQRRRRSRS